MNESDRQEHQAPTLEISGSIKLPEGALHRPNGGEENHRPPNRRWQAIAGVAATAAAMIAVGGLILNSCNIVAANRAWVMFEVSPAGYDPVAKKGPHNFATHGGVGVFVKNFGHGPAFDVQYALFVMPHELPKDLPAFNKWSLQPGTRMLPPGEHTQLGVAIADGFWKTGEVYQMAVIVLYRDQFGRHRNTVFCVKLHIDYWEEENSVSSCDSHNSAE